LNRVPSRTSCMAHSPTIRRPGDSAEIAALSSLSAPTAPPRSLCRDVAAAARASSVARGHRTGLAADSRPVRSSTAGSARGASAATIGCRAIPHDTLPAVACMPRAGNGIGAVEGGGEQPDGPAPRANRDSFGGGSSPSSASDVPSAPTPACRTMGGPCCALESFSAAASLRP
jgi:hypothetical protein